MEKKMTNRLVVQKKMVGRKNNKSIIFSLYKEFWDQFFHFRKPLLCKRTSWCNNKLF